MLISQDVRAFNVFQLQVLYTDGTSKMKPKFSALYIALILLFIGACTSLPEQTSGQAQSIASKNEEVGPKEELISINTVSRGVAISFLVWFAKLFVLSGLERYHTLRLLLADMAYRMRNIEIFIQKRDLETSESLLPEKLEHYVYLSLQKPLRNTLWLSEVDAIRSLYHDFQIVEIQTGKIAELRVKAKVDKADEERCEAEINKRYNLIKKIHSSWLEANDSRSERSSPSNVLRKKDEASSLTFSEAAHFTSQFVFNRIPIYMTAHALPILALAILILWFAGVLDFYLAIISLIVVLIAIYVGWRIVLIENRHIKAMVESAWCKTNTFTKNH